MITSPELIAPVAEPDFESLMAEGVRLHALRQDEAARDVRGRAVVAAEQFGDDSEQMLRALRDLTASLDRLPDDSDPDAADELLEELVRQTLQEFIDRGLKSPIAPREIAATCGQLARITFEHQLDGRPLTTDRWTPTDFYEDMLGWLKLDALGHGRRGLRRYDQYAINFAAGHAAALGRAPRYPAYKAFMAGRAVVLGLMSESPHISNTNPNLSLTQRWVTTNPETGQHLPGPKARQTARGVLAAASVVTRPFSKNMADKLARKTI